MQYEDVDRPAFAIKSGHRVGTAGASVIRNSGSTSIVAIDYLNPDWATSTKSIGDRRRARLPWPISANQIG
ncbi:hypothetical protein XH79_34575 [Bradyrhizobium sp. CCBAU 45389]|nr:hypothetical protein [Bradyrhizobium sp. CCBAU 45389]